VRSISLIGDGKVQEDSELYKVAEEVGYLIAKKGYVLVCGGLFGVMEAGAKGCEIEISGKLVSERARTEKFVAGTIIHTGDPAYSMVRKGFDIAIKKLGVLGVNVRIIPPDVTLPDEFRVDKVESAKKDLKALLDKSEVDSNTKNINIEVRKGRSYSSILDSADDNAVDLIIINSHKPGLEDYLLGSTAAKVARHAKCAVLIER